MKRLIYSFAISFGMMANGANADQVVNVDGEEYLLSDLMANCQSITDDPAAQVSCFSAISKLLDEQSGETQEDHALVAPALDALRDVAQYQDDASGLSIAGSDCNIHILYYNNYFHISRRNISTIDLFSAQFDASTYQVDQTVKVLDAQGLLSKGSMAPGTTAVMRGGVAQDSSQHNFASRSPRTTLADYANEVVAQLPAREGQAFDFVLVHPNKRQASADIWRTFEAFVETCQS